MDNRIDLRHAESSRMVHTGLFFSTPFLFLSYEDETLKPAFVGMQESSG
ncbi:MAG: hypothetical protein RIM83_19200 [Allomuricauda sp.]|jgi:hypothetical protein